MVALWTGGEAGVAGGGVGGGDGGVWDVGLFRDGGVVDAVVAAGVEGGEWRGGRCDGGLAMVAGTEAGEVRCIVRRRAMKKAARGRAALRGYRRLVIGVSGWPGGGSVRVRRGRAGRRRQARGSR